MSEFNYTKGGTFSKSQRKLADINNNTLGPAQYDIHKAYDVVKKKSPARSFSKSPKF